MNDDLLTLAKQAAEATLVFCMNLNWKGVKSLKDQIQRSCFSVPSNIAEGMGRGIGREKTAQRSKANFYRIALGSLKECVTQLDILKAVRPQSSGEITSLISSWMFLEERLVLLVGGAVEAEMSRPIGHDWVLMDPSSWKEEEELGRTCYSRICSGCLGTEIMSIDRDRVRYFYSCPECCIPECEVVFPEDATKELIWKVEEQEHLREKQLKETIERECGTETSSAQERRGDDIPPF